MIPMSSTTRLWITPGSKGAALVTEIERISAVGFLDAFGSQQEIPC
jgi:hypothetical protein